METEKFELMLDEAQANAALEKGMLYADTFVNKNYLINLDRYPLVELDPAEKSDEYIRLYQIERIVYDVDENANDKLISVYSAFFNIQAAGLLVIKSTRNALGFYIGVRSVDNTSTAEAILEKSFKGNFAGSQIQAIPQEEVQKVLGSINKSGRFGTRQNVSSVSIVPSTRDEDKERFVQGIEKFIDTMKGSEYTAVFIAEPLDKEILEQRKRGLQKIYSGLSPFASTQLSYGENYSKAVSKGMSENFSKTLNDSLTDTTSHFNSRSTSRSHGTSFGFLGIGFNNSTSTKIDAVDELLDPASCLKNDSAHIRKGAFDKIDFEDANNEMQSLVESWLGMELYQTVSTQFSNFAFFGLSALGSNPDMDNKIPKFRPFRVADPFLWILSQENIIPTE